MAQGSGSRWGRAVMEVGKWEIRNFLRFLWRLQDQPDLGREGRARTAIPEVTSRRQQRRCNGASTLPGEGKKGVVVTVLEVGSKVLAHHVGQGP